MTQARSDSPSGQRSWLLAGLARFIAARPRTVVLLTVLLALLAATQALRLEVTTSRTNMGHAMTPSERIFGEFLQEFGSPNDFTAVIDGGSPPVLRQAADELAAALAADPARVRSTFHKVDIHFFLQRVLLFVPANELGEIKRILESSLADDIRAGKIDGLDAVVDEMTTAFSARAPSRMDPQRVASGLETLRLIVAELDLRLKDPSRKGLEGLRDLIPPLKAGAFDDEGYLQSRDGGMRVVFIRPTNTSDENAVVLPLVSSLRAQAAQVAARHPGVKIRLAGLLALQADETAVVDKDMLLTTVVSLVSIAVILLYGYRKPQQVLLSLVPLMIGVIWTLAIARLAFGRVNLVASAFMPILLGRGSDFAIYIVARFNAARAGGSSAQSAVGEALSAAGGGIVTGALVTAAAFLVSTAGQMGGFEQLGIVVGVGLVMVLISSVLVTPALLLIVGDARIPGEEAAERALGAMPEFGAGPGAISLRHPGAVLGVTGALVVLLGAYARSVPFDYDLLKFLPARAESVTAQHDLSTRSDYGTDVVVVVADDVEDARKKAALLAAMPNIGRVESVAAFLPSDQDQKLEAIATMRTLVETIPPFAQPSPATPPSHMAQALDKLGDAVDDKIYLAQQSADNDPKLQPVVNKLKDFSATVASALKTLRDAPPEQAAPRLSNVESEVIALLRYSRSLLRDNVLAAKKVSIDDLPQATRERFVGKTGKSALYVFPKKPGAGEELAAFVKDVQSVSMRATGFPIIYFESSRAIKKSFLNAAYLALAVIVFALLLHFRNLKNTALALVPLGIGSVAMLGLMRLFHIDNNVANIASLPLLLGLGTDYGLQIVHHYSTVPDEPLIEVLKKTGLGVFMAGGTTAAGFGALALATHKGAASLGIVLLMGTSAALLCSLVVLPALLALVDRRHPHGPAKPDR